MERNARKWKEISTDAEATRFSIQLLNFVLLLLHVISCYSEVFVHIGDNLNTTIS
jgi:hypothetical protein